VLGTVRTWVALDCSRIALPGRYRVRPSRKREGVFEKQSTINSRTFQNRPLCFKNSDAIQGFHRGAGGDKLLKSNTGFADLGTLGTGNRDDHAGTT